MSILLWFRDRRQLVRELDRKKGDLRRKTGECIALGCDNAQHVGEINRLRDALDALSYGQADEVVGLWEENVELRQQWATRAELDHATTQLETARSMLAERGVHWYPAPYKPVEIKGWTFDRPARPPRLHPGGRV